MTELSQATDLHALFNLTDKIPTIHADGERDDTPGWMAALQNKRVMYDSKLYEPDEFLNVDRWMLFKTDNVLVLAEGQEVPGDIDESWIIITVPDVTREIKFLDPDEDFDAEIDVVVNWGATPAHKRILG